MAIDVDRLRSEIEVDPSRAIAGLKAYDNALSTATRDRDVDVDMDLGIALSDLASFEASANFATRDRTMNIDVDRSALSSVASGLGGIASAATSAGEALADAGGKGGGFGSALTGAFGSAGRGAGLLTAAVAGTVVGLGPLIVAGVAIGSILPGAFAAAAAGAGILMAALVPLVGLLGALPVMIGGLGLAAGALMGGLAGVVGGVTAYKGATEGAAGATEDLTAKQQALTNATHQVMLAERALKDAREDMAKAPREAAEAIEDAHFSAAQAALNEKKAILALQQAQQNLTDAQTEAARASLKVTQQTDEFTGKVYDVAVNADDAANGVMAQRDAALALQQAELDVATAKDANGDAQRHLNEMERKGIKNSDIMVAARRQLADAEWGLKQAHQAVAQAQKNLAKGAAGATAATAAWDKAQQRLSATGVEFVKFIADDFLPALSDIGKEIQDEMLPGLQGGLTILMDDFDAIGNELGIVGGMIGDTFEEFMQFWTLPEQRNLLAEMFDNLNDSIQAGLDLIRPFSRVMVHITNAAAPMFTGILDRIGDKLGFLADKWDKKNSGLVQFFEDAAYFGGLWWDVLEGIWAVLEPIVNAGKPLAARWLKSMADELEDMGDYLASPKGQKMLTQFFEDAVPALKQTWKFVTGIADALFNSSEGGKDSGFYKFMESLNDDFVPALKDLLETLDTSDLASDLTSIFSSGVNFIDALNESGTLQVLDALARVLELGGQVATPYQDNLLDPGTIANGYTEEEAERINELSPGGAGDWTRWEKFKEDLGIINEGIEDWTHATFKDPIIAQWEEITTTLKEEKAIWQENLTSFGGWAKDTWAGIKHDASEKWKGITTALKEERDIWKDRIASFKDWMADLSWGDIWDGLVDAFYTAMEWVADAWNSTLGGLTVNIPGVGEFSIPELNVGDRPTARDMAGTKGGLGDDAPTQPTPGGRGGDTNTGLGAVGDRRNIQINQTFNEKVDPHHLSRELAWTLAS